MAMFQDKDLEGPLGGNLRVLLQNYFLIASNEKPSRSLVASTLSAKDSDKIEIQWNAHEKLRQNFHILILNSKFLIKLWKAALFAKINARSTDGLKPALAELIRHILHLNFSTWVRRHF